MANRCVITPNCRFKHGVGQNSPAVAYHVNQQVKLCPGEMHHTLSDPNIVPPQVYDEITLAQYQVVFVFPSISNASQARLNAGQQFTVVERLTNKVIHTSVERASDIVVAVKCNTNNAWHVCFACKAMA